MNEKQYVVVRVESEHYAIEICTLAWYSLLEEQLVERPLPF